MELNNSDFMDAGADGSQFRRAPSFRLRHRLLRLCWNMTWLLLASWTPPQLHGWRIFLINLFGGRVDRSCFVYGSARIWYPPNLVMAPRATIGRQVDCYTMGPIEIGTQAIISQGAFLCTGTHDIRQPNFQIYARPIRIAADAFVGPGVTVGEGAVLGARAAAFRDLEPWTVYLGNPAAPVRSRPKFTRSDTAS